MEKIKATITGTDQEVFVDVDEKLRYERLDKFMYYLAIDYSKKAENELADEDEDFVNRLTDEERDTVVEDALEYIEKCKTAETEDGKMRGLASLVADNTLYEHVYAKVRDIYENRTKYFRFDIEMTNSFSVWVKARNQSEAETYLENCYASDLEDYYETDNASISVEGCVDESEDEPCDSFIDATDC